ncbi:MAG: hypothetical protein M3P04_08975, partial [Actinomycetota bacterium]|nr:hypothetical protein [Actinomycetota bacterium]
WGSYAVCGHFGGDSSPIRDVHLMQPGQRVSGSRREGGGWELKTSFGRTVDDVVLAGSALRTGSMTQALDLAADGITGALVSAADLSDGEVSLGLSGGKDSRLIAASFIAAGRLPRFNTNVDTPAEGETAARLLQTVRETRDLEPVHRLYNAGAPATVLQTGLRERVQRLQRQHDLQGASTYTVRVPAPARLPATTRAMSFTGAGGELATGYWYPAAGDDQDDAVAREAATVHLLGSDAPVQDHVLEAERARISAVLDHAGSLGLRGAELCDYLYLVERVRRWYTSGYVLGIVTPFLSPGFVTASFALTPAAKRRRVLHVGLLARYVPEWLEVPYVSVSTGRSSATRVWEGDGLQVLCDLHDTHRGDLPRLLRRDDVDRALEDAATGKATKRQEKTLQQLAWLAVASETLEPASVLAVEPTTYAGLLAARPAPSPQRTVPAVPPAVTLIASRVRFVKRTRLGRKAWAAARSRLLTAA